MRLLSLSLVASLMATTAFAQSAAVPLPPPPPPPASGATPAVAGNGCLAVRDAGSHAFRNIMLAGVAGALISKKQYQVVDALDYPAAVGQKFHGNDIQTLQTGGTRIVILGKNYTPEDLHRACR